MTVFGLALQLGNRVNIIFGKVGFVVTFGAVGIFGIGAAHTCFSHIYHLNPSISPDGCIMLL